MLQWVFAYSTQLASPSSPEDAGWWGGATRPDQLQMVRAPSAHLEDLTSAPVGLVSRYPVQPGQRLQQNGLRMG